MTNRSLSFVDVLRSFSPEFWIQNYSFNSSWDRSLKRLMVDCRFEYISQYEAKLGPFVVWIKNYPYAAFKVEGPQAMDILPRRSTRALAKRLYREDTAGAGRIEVGGGYAITRDGVEYVVEEEANG